MAASLTQRICRRGGSLLTLTPTSFSSFIATRPEAPAPMMHHTRSGTGSYLVSESTAADMSGRARRPGRGETGRMAVHKETRQLERSYYSLQAKCCIRMRFQHPYACSMQQTGYIDLDCPQHPSLGLVPCGLGSGPSPPDQDPVLIIRATSAAAV